MQFPFNVIPIEFNSHCIKMRYSIEPRERRYVKGKYLSNKYGQKLVDSAKKNLQEMH